MFISKKEMEARIQAEVEKRLIETENKRWEAERYERMVREQAEEYDRLWKRMCELEERLCRMECKPRFPIPKDEVIKKTFPRSCNAKRL